MYIDHICLVNASTVLKCVCCQARLGSCSDNCNKTHKPMSLRPVTTHTDLTHCGIHKSEVVPCVLSKRSLQSYRCDNGALHGHCCRHQHSLMRYPRLWLGRGGTGSSGAPCQLYQAALSATKGSTGAPLPPAALPHHLPSACMHCCLHCTALLFVLHMHCCLHCTAHHCTVCFLNASSSPALPYASTALPSTALPLTAPAPIALPPTALPFSALPPTALHAFHCSVCLSLHCPSLLCLPSTALPCTALPSAAAPSIAYPYTGFHCVCSTALLVNMLQGPIFHCSILDCKCDAVHCAVFFGSGHAMGYLSNCHIAKRTSAGSPRLPDHASVVQPLAHSSRHCHWPLQSQVSPALPS